MTQSILIGIGAGVTGAFLAAGLVSAQPPAAPAPDPNQLAAENVTLQNKLAVTENILREMMNARRDWEVSARQLDAVVTGQKDQAASAKQNWMSAQSALAATNKTLTDELERAKARCAAEPPKQ